MEDLTGGMDLGALEKMAQSAPRLVGKLDGKLHKAPKQEDDTPTDMDKVAWALAKIVAKTEGDFIHRALKRLIPKEIYYPAEARLRGGDGFTMKKLLNEYDIKITNVMPSPELAAEDFTKGIQRRHIQIWKAGVLKREHVWEWSRAE